jgi:hypothetical protein
MEHCARSWVQSLVPYTHTKRKENELNSEAHFACGIKCVNNYWRIKTLCSLVINNCWQCMSGIVAHTSNSSTQKAEAGGL